MKAIITVDVPKHQIGQEVSVYFKDTMCVNGTCESETEVYAKHDEEIIKETVESIWGKPCGDAVSRQAVLDALLNGNNSFRHVEDIINEIPSVNPQNDVFDKIRTEIEKECKPCIYEIDFAYKKGLSRTLEIIDKYRGEKE